MLVAQAVRDLGAAIAAGRSAAGGLTVAALEQPAETYRDLCSAMHFGTVAVIDSQSNPYGWGKAEAALAGLQLFTPSGGLAELERRLLLPHAQAADSSGSSAVARPGQRCLVVDGASQLVDAFGCGAVAEMLARLQRAPGVAALLCCLHADLHPAQAVAAVQQNAAAVATVLPLTGLERGAARAAAEGQGSWAGGRTSRSTYRFIDCTVSRHREDGAAVSSRASAVRCVCQGG